MSRSYKRAGGTICVCRAGEMKAWKRGANRMLRRKINALLSAGIVFEETPMPIMREIATDWSSPGDGHFYIAPHELKAWTRESPSFWNTIELTRK